MRLFLKYLPVLVLLLFLSKTSQASHAVGADISITWVGPGNLDYEVRLVMYRDCSGSNAPGEVEICYNSTGCDFEDEIELFLENGTGQEITPVCPSNNTICNGGSDPGIQEYIYVGNISLPFPCEDWAFSWGVCCRNAAVSTIFFPENNKIWISATLDNLNAPKNSTPFFTNKPVPFICRDQTFVYNHGAIDPDGDSLVYSSITPMTGSGCSKKGEVSYQAGYSAINPLSSDPPVNIDAFSGDITMTPDGEIVTVMAMLVEEYRNGVKIGSVIRDMQIYVTECDNNLPILTGINGTNNFESTVCPGQEVSFNIFSNDPDLGQQISLSWNSGIAGGAFNTSAEAHPTGTFTWMPTNADAGPNPKTFTITVKDDNCTFSGSQTFSYRIFVTKPVGVSIGNDTIISCDQNITLTAGIVHGSGGYDYYWNTGESAQSISAGAGNYFVTVSDDAGCSSIDSIELTVADAPVASFSFTGKCANSNIDFSDSSGIGLSSIILWQWDFGDGKGIADHQNPSYAYSSEGSYDVKLIVTNEAGCSDSVTKQVDIDSLPQLDISIDSVCLGTATTFSAASSKPINSWQWDFGDGSGASDQQNPSYKFSDAGVYDINLEVVDSEGCSYLRAGQAIVEALPVADFSYTEACENTLISFNDRSSSPGIITSRSWDFGDSKGNSEQSEPEYMYINTGEYSVTLVVASSNGCRDTTEKQLTVKQRATAQFMADTVCEGGVVSFNNTSETNAAVVFYLWDFGDGTGFSDSEDPVYKYSESGTYSVQLSVSSPGWCSDTFYSDVIVNPRPEAGFSETSVCDTVNFTDQSNGSVVAWSWDFGDGRQSDQEHPAHIYDEPGKYLIELITTNTFGCTSKASGEINLDSGPEALFTVENGCVGEPVYPDDQSMTGLGTISEWQWDFGDQQVVTGQSPSYVYETSGAFEISLIVADSNGCKDSVSKKISVHSLPEVDFSLSSSSGSGSLTVQFLNNTAGGKSFTWNFGDGNYSGDYSPVHHYSQPGSYDVSLTVASEAGCEHSLIKERAVNIIDIPIADFTMSSNIVESTDPTVEFTDRSIYQVKRRWYFGDGDTTSEANPVHTYQDTGKFHVVLVVYNEMEYSDTAIKTVVVQSNFVLHFPNAFSPDGERNNEFGPVGVFDGINSYLFQIFNRWGELIFETTDVNEKWNGSTFNAGLPAMEGTYLYFVKVTDYSGKKSEYVGDIFLVR